MGWLAIGVAICGLFVGIGLESLGKSIIFASGQWHEYEAEKEKNG